MIRAFHLLALLIFSSSKAEEEVTQTQVLRVGSDASQHPEVGSSSYQYMQNCFEYTNSEFVSRVDIGRPLDLINYFDQSSFIADTINIYPG